jgi:hypothetical protein
MILDGRLVEGAAGHAHRGEGTPQAEAGDGVAEDLVEDVDVGRLGALGPERRAGVGGGDHEVDLSNAVAMASCRLDPQLLGDGGGVQVVEGLRQEQAGGHLVGEVVGAARPLVGPARRAGWTGCPSSTGPPGSAVFTDTST